MEIFILVVIFMLSIKWIIEGSKELFCKPEPKVKFTIWISPASKETELSKRVKEQIEEILSNK